MHDAVALVAPSRLGACKSRPLTWNFVSRANAYRDSCAIMSAAGTDNMLIFAVACLGHTHVHFNHAIKQHDHAI